MFTFNPNKRRKEVSNSILKAFGKLELVSKAHEEGIYADTPHNRKLGRVGKPYNYLQDQQKANPKLTKEEENKTSSKFQKRLQEELDKKQASYNKKLKQIVSLLNKNAPTSGEVDAISDLRMDLKKLGKELGKTNEKIDKEIDSSRSKKDSDSEINSLIKELGKMLATKDKNLSATYNKVHTKALNSGMKKEQFIAAVKQARKDHENETNLDMLKRLESSLALAIKNKKDHLISSLKSEIEFVKNELKKYR